VTSQAVAIWTIGRRLVELRSESIGIPRGGQVRVQTMVSAISHGTEMLVYRGEVPEDLSLDLPTLVGGFGYPIKYGYACAGRVVDVGEGVSDVRPGSHVFAFHPHQSEFIVDERVVVVVPDKLPVLRIAMLANLETAVNVMLDTPLAFGETVAIFGLGTVGLLLCSLASLRGGEVVAIDPLPRRRECALQWGARLTLEPHERIAEEIRSLTNGRGADVALEASGQPAALQHAIDAVAFQGTVVVTSWYGNKLVSLDLGARFHRDRLRLRSSQVSTIDPALSRRWDRQRRLAVAVNLLDRLPLEDLISHRFPIDAAAAAYDLIDRYPEQVQQVVFEY